jgi:hypothetical protein
LLKQQARIKKHLVLSFPHNFKTQIMFDDILQMVKEHFGGHPALSNLTAEQQDAIHNEIATHVNNTVNAQQPMQSSGGGILNKLENAVASGGTVTSAIEGGLIGTLASKFGLPPSITGAISGALPGLLQKFAAKKVAGA